MTTASFQGDSGTPANPDSNHNFSADPLFIEEDSSYTGSEPYALQPGSPCVGAGIANANIPDDITGATRANPPTMGAYEGVYTTSTSVYSSNNPSHVNNTVTFTATVSATPDNTTVNSGTVAFYANNNLIPGGGSVPLSNGTATVTTSFSASGTYTIKAVYTPATGSNFTGSNGSTTEFVYNAPTANSQSVTVPFETATPITLTGSDPNSPPQPLTYTVGQEPSNGQLSGTAPNLTYTPNPGFHGADSFTFKVNNGYYDSSTATVSITVGAGTPTANPQSVSTVLNVPVNITLTGTDPDSPALPLTDTYQQPAHGTVTGTAPNVTYTPTTGYTGSDSFTFTASNGTNTSQPATVSISVASEQTTTSLTSSASSGSVYGQSVTFTAKVAPDSPGTTTPTGTVTFSDSEGVISGTAPLVNGYATYTTPALTVAGSPDTVTAIYNPQPGFGASDDAISQTINQAYTSVTVSSNPSPSLAGQSVTVTATVTPYAPGSGTPTGTVNFNFGDGTNSGPVALGTAATHTYTTPGVYSVTATYNGDSNFAAGSVGDATQTVNPGAATSFAITGAPSQVTAGQPFTVNVMALDQYGNTATGYSGTVHFTSTDPQATVPANATLTNGLGSFTVTLRTAGTQTVTATDTVSSGISGTSGVITVIPAAASQLAVNVPGIATAGQTISATVTQEDAYGNLVTTPATVTFTSTDPRAALPAATALTNGTATVSLTYNTAGSQVLQPSANGLASGTGTTLVSSSATAPAKVAVSAIAISVSGSVVTAQVTLTNTGAGASTGGALTLAHLGSVNATSLPTLGALAAGQSQVVTLTFPNGPTGTQMLTINGTFNSQVGGSGAFSIGSRVSVP